MDAAVAIGYTLAVTYRAAGNIGGGGFMLIRRADGTSHFIDFRETAPAASSPTMYLDRAGRVVPERSAVGVLSTGVPGTVAVLEYARERFGTRSRRELMSTAITDARHGFTLTDADAGFSPAIWRFYAGFLQAARSFCRTMRRPKRATSCANLISPPRCRRSNGVERPGSIVAR